MNIKKTKENEYDSQFEDYRGNDGKEKTKHINKEFSKLPIHEKLQKLNPKDVMMVFDATS